MDKITDRDIFVYREIYYETVKPMIIAGKSKEEINKAIEYMCQEFEYEVEDYKIMSQLDMIQRIAEMQLVRTNISVQGLNTIKNTLNLPRIRCPRRTEQVD